MIYSKPLSMIIDRPSQQRPQSTGSIGTTVNKGLWHRAEFTQEQEKNART